MRASERSTPARWGLLNRIGSALRRGRRDDGRKMHLCRGVAGLAMVAWAMAGCRETAPGARPEGSIDVYSLGLPGPVLPYENERRAAFSDLQRAQDTDVLCLLEPFRDQDKDALIDPLLSGGSAEHRCLSCLQRRRTVGCRARKPRSGAAAPCAPGSPTSSAERRFLRCAHRMPRSPTPTPPAARRRWSTSRPSSSRSRPASTRAPTSTLSMCLHERVGQVSGSPQRAPTSTLSMCLHRALTSVRPRSARDCPGLAMPCWPLAAP